MVKEKHVNPVHFHHWNRIILNTYWGIALIDFIAQTAAVAIKLCEGENPFHRIWQLLIIPTLSTCLIFAAAEVANRFHSKWSNTFIIVAGTAIGTVMIEAYAFIDGIQMILLLSLLGSLAYYQKRKILFSFGLNLTALFLMYELDPVLHRKLSPLELIMTVTAFVVALIIIMGIMKRGMEIQASLFQTMKDQQDLLVQNVIMEKLAKTDALTELYNHKTFHEYLDKLVEHAEANHLPLALAIIDIDNFKKVNDTYGHWVGDMILRRVSQAIREQICQDDFPARYGGEEFAVIFADKSFAEAYRMAENIRLAISGLAHEELNGGQITVSIGLQPYVRGKGKESLFKGADSSLYKAKKTGKNKTVIPADLVPGNDPDFLI